MNILYVGYYTSDEILYEIQNRGINNMSVARQKYETNLLKGIIENNTSDDIKYVSYVPVDDVYSIPNFSFIGEEKVYHIPINRKSIKSIVDAGKRFENYLCSFGLGYLQNLHVIMYEVNPVFMHVLLKLKAKYNMKLITLCAELSMLRRSKKIKYQIRNYLFSIYEKRFDAFVLFARAMAEVLQCRDRPNIVVEGIAPEIFGSTQPREKKIVMYAGGLGSDNNIKLLIDACSQIDELDELWICGTGKDRNLVETADKSNDKIKYFGMIENDKVRDLETHAKILVNLRNPDAEITRYSFPSKILEYMASGTLVLSTMLEGIPEEYFRYIIPIKTLDLQSVTESIKALLNLDEDIYHLKSKNAQQYIEVYKNKAIQTKRIMEFVRSI